MEGRSYGSRITEQHRRLGASCDWTRERFTLDEGLSRAVREAFVRLYEKGLIYRGDVPHQLVPALRARPSPTWRWSTRTRRAKLWYVRYPLRGAAGEHITVATTRPETMLGDTAVAVQPGRRALHATAWARPPSCRSWDGRIPIIADEAVDPEFGTGAVKVTPAHDPNDFEIGQRHGLPVDQRHERRRHDERERRAVRRAWTASRRRKKLVERPGDGRACSSRSSRLRALGGPLPALRHRRRAAHLRRSGS